MVNFKKVVHKLDGGYIAVVDKNSTKSEKNQVARFSCTTKGILGLGAGYLGIESELTPLVESGDWDERPWNDYLGPHKLHVFVLVLNGEIVGYMPMRWHWNIHQGGHCLDAEGKPIKSGGKLVILRIGEEPQADQDEEPKRLEGWGIEGICILPNWQHRGLGKLLVKKALEHLGVSEKEVAWDPPFTDAGKALVRSIGLTPDEVRQSPGL